MAMKRLSNIRAYLINAIQMLSDNDDLRLAEQRGTFFRFSPTGVLHLQAINQTPFDPDRTVVPYSRGNTTQGVLEGLGEFYKQAREAYCEQSTAEFEESLSLRLHIIDSHFQGHSTASIARALQINPHVIQLTLDQFGDFITTVNPAAEPTLGQDRREITVRARITPRLSTFAALDSISPNGIDAHAMSDLTGQPVHYILDIMSKLRADQTADYPNPRAQRGDHGTSTLYYQGRLAEDAIIEIVGLSVKEIAVRMDVPPESVASVLAQHESPREDGSYGLDAWKFARHTFRKPEPGSFMLKSLAQMYGVSEAELRDFIATTGGSSSEHYDKRGNVEEYASNQTSQLILQQDRGNVANRVPNWISRVDVDDPDLFDAWIQSLNVQHVQRRVQMMRRLNEPGLGGLDLVLPHYSPELARSYRQFIANGSAS